MTTVARELSAPTLDEIQDAQRRLKGIALRTPLVRLEVAGAPAELWLKLENLQPIGSFKIRGAGNAMLSTPLAELERGVYTASAGNMAQGVAYLGRKLGVPSTMIVPEHAPQAKLAAIERLGGRIVKVPFDRWWQTILEHEYPGMDGIFIHPVADRRVMAGNGTVGLEILEELPDVDAVLVPDGGGGLSVKSRQRFVSSNPVPGSSPVRWRLLRRSALHSPPARRWPASIPPALWTASGGRACWSKCGRSPARCWTEHSWFHWLRLRAPSDCW
jgi:threonine dehydratase